MAVSLLSALSSGCTQEVESRPKPAPQKQPHLVELAPVVVDTLRITSVYTGSLRHRQTVRIFNQEEGRVLRLPYYEGDSVEAGTVVLELDDALIKSELRKAKAVRREAEANRERLRRLLDKKVVSEDEYVRAETAVEVAKAEEAILETRLGYTRVTAPFDGVVAARLVEPGDIVPRHTHVLTIVDPTSLITELGVSELLVPHIQIDDRVDVRIDALGDQHYSGGVLRIHPELDPQTRQGRVEVEIEPVPDGAQSGQFVRVTFNTTALNRKVIPFAAMRRDREGEYVFAIDAHKHVHRTAIRSGRRLADRVEILDGLRVGERVVVRGFLGLSDGEQVEPVNPAEQRAEDNAQSTSDAAVQEGS